MIGNAIIDTPDPIAGIARQLGWKWKTSAAGKVVKNIYVRVGAPGAFAPGTKAQLWKVAPAPTLLQSLDISALTSAEGVWLAVPGVTATALTVNDFYYVTVFHPATDPGNYTYKGGFGNPTNGSLSGNCIFKNGVEATSPPDNETFGLGAFAVDIEIDDAAPGDAIAPTAPSNLVVSQPGSGQVQLTWNASSDNVAVAGYDIYANGTLRAALSGAALSYLDSQPDAATIAYQLRARDAAGNVSAPSATVIRPGVSQNAASKAMLVKVRLHDLLKGAASVANSGAEVTYGFPSRPPSRRWVLVSDVRWDSAAWVTNRSREERFRVKVYFSVQLPAGNAFQAEQLAVSASTDFEYALKADPGLSGLAVSTSFAPVSLRSWPVDGAYEAQYEVEVTATCRT